MIRVPARFMNRMTRDPLLCRLFGHRWPEQWGDNGCYMIHEDEPPGAKQHWHLFTRWCERCQKISTKFEPRGEE